MKTASCIGACLAAAFAASVGCGSSDRSPAPRPPASPSVAPAADPPAPPARDRDRDVHGLTVKVNADDTIRVRGSDRWGTPFDTTYETALFLRNALPSLERSITAEQAAGLRAVLDEIQGAE